MKEKDRYILFSLLKENTLTEIVEQLGLDSGFQAVINSLYDAIAKTSKDYEAARVIAKINREDNRVSHLGVMVSDLNNLIAALENATTYHAATPNRPANEDEILQANIEFSLVDIFKAFCLRYGTSRSLEAFQQCIKELEENNREIARLSLKNNQQEMAERFLIKADKLSNLLQAMIVGKEIYQSNPSKIFLDEEQIKLCQTSMS